MADTVKLGPFTGVNNRRKRHALFDEATKTYALQSAENVIVDTTGRIARRSGFTLSQTLVSGDSLWSDGANLYYRNNGYLYRDNVVLEAVAGRCSYAKFPGGGVIYTDGSILRFIDTGGTASSLAPQRPAAVSTSSTSGALQPAKYMVAITGVDANSVEGPASLYAAIELAAAGGITVSLPALPSGAETFNVYVTGPNGEVPTLHGSTALSSYTITTYAEGRSLTTGGLLNMPAGDIVRIHNGRLLVASGRVLYVSEAYNYGVYDPSVGYFVFPESITIAVPLKDGVYIAADNTYWLSGVDVRASELVQVLPYGALAGSDTYSDTTERVAWMTAKGAILADAAGQVDNIQEAEMTFDIDGSRGAAAFVSDEDRLVVVANA